MKNEVFWKNPGYRARPALRGNARCKYLVVGGGVTGVSLAYLLARRGADVALVEKSRVGSGATGRAAGALTPYSEMDRFGMIDAFGKRGSLIFYYSILNGLHTVRRIIETERIDCMYEDEITLFAEGRQRRLKEIFEEYKIEKVLHMKAKMLVGKELDEKLHTNFFKDGLLLHRGFSINPLKYVQGLSTAASEAGARIYENTPLLHASSGSAKTPLGKIEYDKIIFATDAFSKARGIIPVQTTICVTRRLAKSEMKNLNIHEKIIAWDAKSDYDYFKITKDNRILAGFGMRAVRDTRNALNNAHVRHIKRFLKTAFPEMSLPVEYAWSGIEGMTRNRVMKIEFRGSRASILAPMGIPDATVAAKYVANKLAGKRMKLDRIFLRRAR